MRKYFLLALATVPLFQTLSTSAYSIYQGENQLFGFSSDGAIHTDWFCHSVNAGSCDGLYNANSGDL